MKKFKAIILFLLLFGPVTATIARADHWHHGGGHFGVGIVIDPWPLAFPYAYPYGYYPYGYYPYGYSAPVVVTQQAAPTTYMEQNTADQGYAPPSRQAAQSNDWYYCRKSEGYYPYVRACPDGWQRVPAQPPTQQ